VLAQADHVMAVPESAIEFSGDSTFVYVASGTDGDKPRYERRPVVIGLSDGVNIEIKSGITLKDKLRGPQIITEEETDNE